MRNDATPDNSHKITNPQKHPPTLTLYVSDLDGTLMQPDATVSSETARLLNSAIASGALFTVATARTPATVSRILQPIDMRLPAIVMTGASVWDPRTGLYSNIRHFKPDAAQALIDTYRLTDTNSFIFTLDNNIIDIYHVGGPLNEIQQQFYEERKSSPFKRFHLSDDGSDTLPEDLSKLILAYTMLPDAKAFSTYQESSRIPGIRAQYYHDIFGPEVGILEAFADDATKANAVRRMADDLGAQRIVCFGDNINDLPMMAVADVAVAVENALPEVKEAADIIIGPNTDDSVARFIVEEIK